MSPVSFAFWGFLTRPFALWAKFRIGTFFWFAICDVRVVGTYFAGQVPKVRYVHTCIPRCYGAASDGRGIYEDIVIRAYRTAC